MVAIATSKNSLQHNDFSPETERVAQEYGHSLLREAIFELISTKEFSRIFFNQSNNLKPRQSLDKLKLIYLNQGSLSINKSIKGIVTEISKSSKINIQSDSLDINLLENTNTHLSELIDSKLRTIHGAVLFIDSQKELDILSELEGVEDVILENGKSERLKVLKVIVSNDLTTPAKLKSKSISAQDIENKTLEIMKTKLTKQSRKNFSQLAIDLAISKISDTLELSQEQRLAIIRATKNQFVVQTSSSQLVHKALNAEISNFSPSKLEVINLRGKSDKTIIVEAMKGQGSRLQHKVEVAIIKDSTAAPRGRFLETASRLEEHKGVLLKKGRDVKNSNLTKLIRAIRTARGNSLVA